MADSRHSDDDAKSLATGSEVSSESPWSDEEDDEKLPPATPPPSTPALGTVAKNDAVQITFTGTTSKSKSTGAGNKHHGKVFHPGKGTALVVNALDEIDCSAILREMSRFEIATVVASGKSPKVIYYIGILARLKGDPDTLHFVYDGNAELSAQEVWLGVPDVGKIVGAPTWANMSNGLPRMSTHLYDKYVRRASTAAKKAVVKRDATGDGSPPKKRAKTVANPHSLLPAVSVTPAEPAVSIADRVRAFAALFPVGTNVTVGGTA